MHLPILGDSADDRTTFSQTKRRAERAIMAGTVPLVVLRPWFVLAAPAYGGLVRRRVCGVLSLGCVTGAAVVRPDFWIEPLAALV